MCRYSHCAPCSVMLTETPMVETQVRAVALLAEAYDYGRGALHARKVADLATSISDQLQMHGLLPGLTLSDRRTLTAISYVHNIGASPLAQQESGGAANPPMTPDGTDRSGEIAFHVLRARLDASPIPDFTAEDRSLLLYSLLWSTAPSTRVVDAEPLLDRHKTLVLAGILRVAEALDFHLKLRVRDVRIQKASAWLRFLVRSLAPATEEVTRCQEETTMLSQALGLRISVQEVLEG
jgi:hypothetical protein